VNGSGRGLNIQAYVWEKLKKIKKKTQNNRLRGRGFNAAPAKCEAGILTIRGNHSSMST